VGTLERWKWLLNAIPRTIECPEMKLLGRDFEPPVFTGSGHIDIKSSTVIEYTMFAQPIASSDDAFRRLLRAQENPYEIVDQFRLVATDYDGTEWTCGWTQPSVKGIPRTGWPLTGKLNSLLTIDSSNSISQESGVELAFDGDLALPMDKVMLTVSSVEGKEVHRSWRQAEHTLNVLNSEIKFFYPPGQNSLWVTAKTSDKLPHPFVERWIAEPLRILLGQLIYPRLRARNLGNGRAQVWLSPSPQPFHGSSIASLLSVDPVLLKSKFWELYTALLTIVAEARGQNGQLNLESNSVTRYYEEIIQATRGSRWVLCMTLASVAEGLTNLLMRPEDRGSEFNDDDIRDLRKVIKDWNGCTKLKDRVLGWFSWLGEKSVASYLRLLVTHGVLKTEHERAWSDLRNAVMHGKLVSPWGTKEEDERFAALIDLVHNLTYELIRRNSESTVAR
jgi:hypothetical protein